MKVVIVNFSDLEGGASRAANRLHHSLLIAGVNSQMLVHSKSGDDYTVVGPQTKAQKFAEVLRPTLDSIPVKFYKNRTKTPFSTSWIPFSGVADKINSLHPDIVHLHWIGNGMMNIKEITKIRAPIIWSLHDMWPFSGGCHYDEDCAGYKKICGNCKVLGSEKAHDLSRKIFHTKAKSFKQIHSLTIVGLSKWLASRAKESTLFKDREVVNLPNTIDTQLFSPVSKSTARYLFNLPQEKKLVLFGAVSATSDPRKGYKEICNAFSKLEGNDDVELLILGSSLPKNPLDFKYKTHYLGYLHDDISLKVLYSAADVVVVPSLQENLSNAIMESLSCGTPVVAFDIGGNSDMIEHRTNGYLAKPFDTTDLAKGIDWIAYNSSYSQLSQSARKKATETFDYSIVARQYIRLYRSVLSAAKDR